MRLARPPKLMAACNQCPYPHESEAWTWPFDGKLSCFYRTCRTSPLGKDRSFRPTSVPPLHSLVELPHTHLHLRYLRPQSTLFHPGRCDRVEDSI